MATRRVRTFWDYFRLAFERNRGIRIDHFPAIAETGHTLEELRDRQGAQLYFQPDLSLATPQRCSVDSS
jgi:hypothetical protein